MIYNFGPEFMNDDLDSIDRAVPWINRDGAPRDECFMSTKSDSYTYGHGRGVRTYYPIPYTSLIDAVRVRVKTLTGVDYEACFLNKYIDQHKHLGWHADDSPTIDHSKGITIISYGAERELWARENGKSEVTKMLMPHGSMIIMPPGFQQTHQHRIPKHSAPCGMRISLTFRKLI